MSSQLGKKIPSKKFQLRRFQVKVMIDQKGISSGVIFTRKATLTISFIKIFPLSGWYLQVIVY